jgi:hypothetical protein
MAYINQGSARGKNRVRLAPFALPGRLKGIFTASRYLKRMKRVVSKNLDLMLIGLGLGAAVCAFCSAFGIGP